MYNPKSLKAEEFISDGEIRETLAYADANKENVELIDQILAKAKENEMKVWILDDSHFPTGYANGKVKECYPQYLKKYLDMRRYDVQGPMRQMRIDLKLLKGRPWDKPDPEQKS